MENNKQENDFKTVGKTKETIISEYPEYLEYAQFELNRKIKRKDIIENKAYILGTVLVTFYSFNKDFFNLYIFLNEIKNLNSSIFLIIILKSIAVLSFILSLSLSFFTIKPEYNLYFTPDILNEKDLSKEKIQKLILMQYKNSGIHIYQITEKKAKYLMKGITSATVFFILYFLFNIVNIK